ncbi:hypothetical protein [Crassaminicella profunda]|uniref:hypothetical protein n=1 Tax=Crassaminicella profunda TaxID=1286698 RepID=UPI001CA77E8C|nr:hypothetical protein [Crassaminicella profunda]QZY56877.1 hypothetical protein K7H06_08150 [Crassaminicella profunda]
MDEKIICLLEQINEKLERIENTLKGIDKKELFNANHKKYKTKETFKDKEIKKNENNEDILENWESKMPYDEVIKKMYTYKKSKE